MIDESMDSGTSTRDCTSWTVRARIAGSAARGLHRAARDRRLVRERDAGVDVEHGSARLDLGQRVPLDPAEVAVAHLLGQMLAAGRGDPLADEEERPIEPQD